MIRLNIEHMAYQIDKLLDKYMDSINIKDGVYALHRRSPLFVGDFYYSRGDSIYLSETLYRGRGDIIRRDGGVLIYEHQINTEHLTEPSLSIIGASIIKSIIDLYRVKTFKGDTNLLFTDYLEISSNLSLVAVDVNAAHVRDAIEYALLSFARAGDLLTMRGISEDIEDAVCAIVEPFIYDYLLPIFKRNGHNLLNIDMDTDEIYIYMGEKPETIRYRLNTKILRKSADKPIRGVTPSEFMSIDELLSETLENKHSIFLLKGI